MTADTISRPTYCPEWCVVTAEQHEAEREQWEGACVHWSGSFGNVDDEDLVIGLSTDEDGTIAGTVTVHVGVVEYSLAEAQRMAQAFAAAFAQGRETADLLGV